MSLNKHDPRARILPVRQTLRAALTAVALQDADQDLETGQLKQYLLRIEATDNRILKLPDAAKVVDEARKIGLGAGIDFVVQHTGTAGIVTLATGAGGTMDGVPEVGAGETRRFFLRNDNGATGSEAYTVFALGGGAASAPLSGACGQMEAYWAAQDTGYLPIYRTTIGDAGVWNGPIITGQGVELPSMLDSTPSVLNNMEIWDTGRTTNLYVAGDFFAVPINALRLDSSLSSPDAYYGVYRYEVVCAIYDPNAQAAVSRMYKIVLARNGVPINDPYGTQGNNTHYAQADVAPYYYQWVESGFPEQGPRPLVVGGLTHINARADYFTVFLMEFRNGDDTTGPIQVHQCTLSMTRVAPLNSDLVLP